MKTPLIKLGSLLLLTLLAFNARAYVLFQDNINYANGYLTNVSADTWSGAPGDASATIGVTNNYIVIPGNSLTDQPRTYFTNGISTNIVGKIINAPVPPVPVYFFPSNAPVAALYYSYSMSEVGPVPTTSTYISFFCDTNFDYRGRLYVATNGAASGNFRLGIANGSSPNPATNIVQQDLSLNTPYTVVVRYVLSSGLATLWVNPVSEADSSPSEVAAETQTTSVSLGGNTNTSTCGLGLRNASGTGTIAINNVIMGTTFGDVIPASIGSNPPFIVTQPQDDTSAITGDNVTFATFAGGDTNITYQWYNNSLSDPLLNQTNTTLTLPGVTTTSSGTYFCVAHNGAGNTTTRSAQLTVFGAAVGPTISAQPQSTTDNVGDVATFSVAATGVPPPGYQWSVITNSGATFKTNAIAGATSSTYTINNLTNSYPSYDAYFVTITNRGGSITSTVATLTVNPLKSVTIAAFRSMVDGTYTSTNPTSIFSLTGTVTTWTNLTGTGSTEFCIQDGTAGITVYWEGAPSSTNRPPAGAIVTVTGPLTNYAGLLEIQPVFTNAEMGIKVVSTNNPLPVAEAIPFDPNVTTAQLKSLESMYCVASNVFLASAPTFASGINENITNNNNLVLADPIPDFSFTNAAGELFDIYVNEYVGIAGQPQPSGPVTIYGVLSSYNGQFEFTPSRYADIISYNHITNYLSNIVRAGDALTNTYSEGALPPGETWTTFASIGDAAGGSVTLTPSYAGLPAGASWSNITNGLIGTAVFNFTPDANDAGTNYVITLDVASTSGSESSYSWNIYVPTPDEQQMAITEFLANPTTNTSSPLFNPLGRGSDTTGIAANDQYVEIANQSPDGYDMQGGIGWDIDSGNPSSPLENFDGSADVMLNASSDFVVYGGPSSGGASLPGGVTAIPSSESGLSLPTTGTGVIILRNGSGYIVDRVVYNGSTLPTNCSMSRFPTINSPFVPQAYISTNVATAGLQYDGGSWGLPTKVPTGLTGVGITVTNKQAVLKFLANTTQANTLWEANTLTGPWSVLTGGKFGSGSGVFNVTNLPPTYQFYFITTQ